MITGCPSDAAVAVCLKVCLSPCGHPPPPRPPFPLSSRRSLVLTPVPPCFTWAPSCDDSPCQQAHADTTYHMHRPNTPPSWFYYYYYHYTSAAQAPASLSYKQWRSRTAKGWSGRPRGWSLAWLCLPGTLMRAGCRMRC